VDWGWRRELSPVRGGDLAERNQVDSERTAQAEKDQSHRKWLSFSEVNWRGGKNPLSSCVKNMAI